MRNSNKDDTPVNAYVLTYYVAAPLWLPFGMSRAGAVRRKSKLMENDASSTAVLEPPKNIEQRGSDLHLVAETPAEMAQCNAALIEWCRHKIEAVFAESAELKAAYEHALAQKWKTSVLKRHWQMADKRLNYYQKILAALEQGYYIVPNFPITVFALRTDRNKPRGTADVYHWETFEQKSASPLPQGEGEYQNPFPVIYERNIPEKNKEGVMVPKKYYFPKEWDDLEFPISMAKPQIMQTTTRAMALKLFDEIGILPKAQAKEDPLIVGRINLKTGPYTNKTVTFILGWHLNTRDL